MSHAPAGAGPSKLAEVTHFFLNPGGEDDFNADIAKINDAITKSNWGSRYFWYTLINGGEGPHYVLVVAHDNWADFAEPDPPFPAMLEKALGKHDVDTLMQSVYKNIRKEMSEVLRFRPDLSYMPGK